MPAPDKFSFHIGRFPGGSVMPIDMPDTTDYFAQVVHEMKTDPRCSDVFLSRKSDTPITMSRNWMIEQALAMKSTFMLMIDNDMFPDLYLGKDPFAEPFLKTSLNFMLDRWDEGPHIVGAPYCGPPPYENVYVFRWSNYQSEHPDPDYHLEQFGREEAARKIGFEQVAALPTGLILYDMRVFTDLGLKQPYFYYEWKDQRECEKASTEDVTQTRDAGLRGAKVWCLWSAWAGHYKLKCVGKPRVIVTEQVSKQMTDAVKRDWKAADRELVMGNKGGNYVPAKLTEEKAG